MNILFTVIFLICTFLLLCSSPENFLSAMLEGAGKSATLCFSLLASYAVWLGLMKVWEDSGISRGVSRLLKPLSAKIFRTENEETLQAVCMNLSVNLLGISGAATPYGIQAAKLLDKTENAEYVSALFFVLNATSIQLFPTSIIAIRTSLNSASPSDIVLPILLSSLCCTCIGVLLTVLVLRPKRAAVRSTKSPRRWDTGKKREAGF